uniref:Protein arginine N-methyltransferase n=1 Tax=Amorphochlora amoebiformis TaxID=1561963 RepID=A0A7S0DME2_9EUKA
MSGAHWTAYVVGKLSEWTEEDSKCKARVTNSSRIYFQELAWATHLNIGVVTAKPDLRAYLNFARLMSQGLNSTGALHFWVDIPMVAPKLPTVVANTLSPGEEPWEVWNTIRTMCEGNRRLGVLLRMPDKLPKEDIIQRWKAEPIRGLVVPTTAFTASKDLIPKLSKEYAKAFLGLITADTRIIISGSSIYPNGHEPFLGALRSLWQSLPPPTEDVTVGIPYRDFLQAPLQPLMDNLQSQTYEVFEKDPVKYSQYQKAIYTALTTKYKDEKSVCVVVVGAGRGPLVRCALRASQEAKKDLRLYAVEKNPNAIVTLRNAEKEEWKGRVKVIQSDMRQWEPDEKADILVSELLGSFGDNELSPECLDGAQHSIKTSGISIPKDSTSYLQPVAAPKVWGDLQSQHTIKAFETPYVVLLHRFCPLAQSEACFKFVHPNHEKPLDNTREKLIRFQPAKIDSILHGFAGYFESTLYEEVNISIRPKTFSKGMFSWFPIFFPLCIPLKINKGQTVEMKIWRRNDESKVWYEWCVIKPSLTPIHNSNGRSYHIGLR